MLWCWRCSSFQVHSKFRFPFYYEMCWYVLERYLHCLTKRSYLSQEFRKEPVVMTGEWIGESEPNLWWHNYQPHLLSFLSDIETKTNTGSPFSDSRSQDTNEDSCETAQVRDDHCEKPGSFAQEGPCSPDSRRVQNLKTALSVDSEDSCNPGSTSLDFIQTPLDSPASEPTSRWTHLTSFELSGLRMLVEKLESLPESKRCVPEGIENPQALLDDMKVGQRILDQSVLQRTGLLFLMVFQVVLKEHADDDPRSAITGVPVVYWPKKPLKVRILKDLFYFSRCHTLSQNHRIKKKSHLFSFDRLLLCVANVPFMDVCVREWLLCVVGFFSTLSTSY